MAASRSQGALNNEATFSLFKDELHSFTVILL